MPRVALRWPLDLPPALSSTFGETRATAFHAGIDLKTWGKTGYAVRAAGEGWVERARTSPWGFGRVLYLRLTDGRIAVYAHLDSFFAPVQQRIRAAQREQGRYSVQLWFEKGEIAVRRAQVIAATGKTGAGPPHLHFELRDSANVPMNALLEDGVLRRWETSRGDVTVADHRPPVIRRLLVVPRGPGALADGGHEPVAVPLRWDEGQRRFLAVAPVTVFGRVGIGVESFDTADAADNKMAPLRQALRVDGAEVFSARLQRLSIADWHQVALDRWRRGAQVFTNLFLRPGNRLPFYRYDGSAGWLIAGGEALPPGDHTIEVVVADAAGNEARAAARLRVAASFAAALGTPPGADGTPAADRALAVDEETEVELHLHERFAALYVRGPRPRVVAAGRDLPLLPRGTGYAGVLPYAALAGGGEDEEVEVQVYYGTAAASPPDTTLYLSAQSIRPGEANNLSYGAGAMILHVAAGSAYEPLFPQVRPAPPVASPGLRGTPLGYTVEPRTVSFDAWARLSFAVPAGADPRQLGVYVADGEGGWVFIGNRIDGGESVARDTGAATTQVAGAGAAVAEEAGTGGTGLRVSARIRAFGHFALLADVTPPAVSLLEPRSRTWVEDRRPWLRARVVDHGSGIGDELDLTIELNGRKLIPIYDPEADLVEARPEEPLPDGEYEWTVRARDQSGNEQVARGLFGLR